MHNGILVSCKEKLNYKNSTCIVTDGTYFLHMLKNKLYELNAITNTHCISKVNEMYDKIIKCHNKVSKLNINKYPCAIYNLFYQDGVIHALERFLKNYCTGEYNCPSSIPNLVNSYQIYQKQYYDHKKYSDVAYYEGYIKGLILINVCEKNKKNINNFPFLYLPNAKKELSNCHIFIKELKRVSLEKDKYHKQAKLIIAKNAKGNLILHHPPY